MTTLDQRNIIDTTRCRPEEAARARIQIGGTPRTFSLLVTAAPRRYDYHGRVIEVMEQDGVRWVLVDASVQPDQEARYSSGLYASAPSLDPTTEGIHQLLWARLFGPEMA